VRDGVREAVLTSLARDLEHRGGSTGRRLLAAGVLGVAGALGATLMLAGHPFGHHPPWHVIVFSTVWTGILVVLLALAFLGVRTPTMSIGVAAQVGVLALAVAGICSLLCPDRHLLHWWLDTAPGGALAETGGTTASILCFGFVTTLAVSLVSTALVFRRRPAGPRPSLLPAAMVLVLLMPGVALQSVSHSLVSFGAWLAGTALGALLGVRGALAARNRLASRRG
jgi:hypothetical protein